MTDDAKLAEAIYGDTTPAEPPTEPEPRQTGEKSAAERIFGEGPEPQRSDWIKDLRRDPEADPKSGEGETVNLTEAAEDLGLDPEHPQFEAFQGVADELGLSKENAQKLIEFDAQRNIEAWEKMSSDWRAEAEASPTFDADVSAAKGVLRAHADDALLADLERFGLGNNPAVVRFLGRIGMALGHR